MDNPSSTHTKRDTTRDSLRRARADALLGIIWGRLRRAAARDRGDFVSVWELVTELTASGWSYPAAWTRKHVEQAIDALAGTGRIRLGSRNGEVVIYPAAERATEAAEG